MEDMEVGESLPLINLDASTSSDANILRKNLKRKAKIQISKTEYNVSTKNKFEVLSNSEDTSEDETNFNNRNKTNKMPPVVIQGAINYNTIKQLKEKLNDNLLVKYKGKKYNLITTNINDYQTVLNFAKENKEQYHTYTIPSSKPIKFILKNLPPEITADQIKEDLENSSISTLDVKQMIKKDAINNKEIKLPMYVINFPPTVNKSEIYKIKSVCQCIVQWENYKNKKSVIQCYKCQSYGHVSKNCYRSPKCMKCASSHYTSLCDVTDEKLFKCANCKGNHLANDTMCEEFLKIENYLYQKSKFIPSNIRSGENISKVNTKFVPENNIKNFPKLPIINVNNNNNKSSRILSNKTSTTANITYQNVDQSQNSIGDFFTEIKTIFSLFNLNKIKQTINKISNSVKMCNDSWSKMLCLVEGLFEILDG